MVFCTQKQGKRQKNEDFETNFIYNFRYIFGNFDRLYGIYGKADLGKDEENFDTFKRKTRVLFMRHDNVGNIVPCDIPFPERDRQIGRKLSGSRFIRSVLFL